jgi:endosialidase-like protein
MKTTTLPSKHWINRAACPLVLLFIPLVLTCFALSPQAWATCQEGCLANNNTVLGDDALLNSTGGGNTATGFAALQFNTTGSENTAFGNAALESNTIGFANTAVGWAALAGNVAGNSNTAVGWAALIANTSGGSNTAVGTLALDFNTTGDFNTAIGVGALETNGVGNSNIAIGFYAAQLNKRGNNNTVIGDEALRGNKHGSSNTGLGYNSLYNCQGSNNIALGDSAGINLRGAENNIEIGNGGLSHDMNTIRIGNETHTVTYMAGISGATVPNGVGVIIDTDGHLGTVVSSERFKDDVKPMDKASEAILALKPVTFRYKHDLDPEGTPQFGLVAEDVEKVNPDLVARDEQGRPYTVRYEAVNAMLLNEFLKEHQTVQELKKQVAELTAGLQKVSAQLEVSKPALQTVLNNQ